MDKDLAPAWQRGTDLSLKGILAEHPPVTDIQSWNDLLKHYGVLA